MRFDLIAPPLAFFDMPRLPELILILVVALIIFGRRLPDVAKSIGRSITEFKKGLRGAESEIEQANSAPPPASGNAAASNPPPRELPPPVALEARAGPAPKPPTAEGATPRQA